MPTYNPSQLHALLNELFADNVNNEITAADARTMLAAIIDSFYNLVSSPNPNAPTLENVLIEGNESGAKNVVITNGQYLWFRSASNNELRLRPQDADAYPGWRDVQIPAKSGVLAMLSDIVASSWLLPVSAELAVPTGTESVGTRILVAAGATGDFAGKDGQVAVRETSGWSYMPTNDGDMVRVLTDTNGVIRSKEDGIWIVPDGPADMNSLANVLGIGNTTSGHDMEVSQADAVAFRNNGFLMRLIGQDIAQNEEVIMPPESGTLATQEVVNALLAMQTLHEVLVNGTETDGRSITVSEGDGVNFNQGVNYARVKAPAALTAVRSLSLPDKDGTLATVDDVAAVAALVDGTMRAPEAYTPNGGLYPSTYGGNAIERGDTFRCAAGTMGAVSVDAEDLLIALVDAPGQTDGNWQVIESNRVVATKAEVEDSTSTDQTKLVPPMRWWQAWTKGLSLTAFANAVRGMVLTGYAVGANAAIAATDTIMGALAKLQGQLNATNSAVSGKLAKASNLGDVANAGTARANLGLGAYATQDYAEAVVSRTMFGIDVVTEPGYGSVVVMDGSGKYYSATPSNAVGARLAIVSERDGSNARVQFGGLIWLESVPLVVGADYYLDPSTPGGITSARPAGHAIYVGTAMPDRWLDFRPAPMVNSGSAVLETSSVTSDVAGVKTDLVSLDLLPGVYHVDVFATVRASIGAGRAKLWLATSGTARGTLIYARGSTRPEAGLQLAVGDLLSPDDADTGDVAEGVDVECHLHALVQVAGKSTVEVMLGPLNDTKEVVLVHGSVITWKKIG